MSWRTRKRGTFLQQGLKFPVRERQHLPPRISLKVGKKSFVKKWKSWDCHECGVKEGEIHEPGCDMERCPICGGQLISCGHYDKVIGKMQRLPYLLIPVKCGICGEQWPEMFDVPDTEWEKYVLPELQGELLCRECYEMQKVVFPKGWRIS